MDEKQPTWDTVADVWRRSAAAHGLQLEQLFEVKHLKTLPGTRLLNPVVTYSLAVDLEDTERRWQQAVLANEHKVPVEHVRVTQLDTLCRLSALLQNSAWDRMIALLLAASIEAHTSKLLPTGWPMGLAQQLWPLCCAAYGGDPNNPWPWRRGSSAILPGTQYRPQGKMRELCWQDDEPEPKTLAAFVRVLAREHAGIFSAWRPVQFWHNRRK